MTAGLFMRIQLRVLFAATVPVNPEKLVPIVHLIAGHAKNPTVLPVHQIPSAPVIIAFTELAVLRPFIAETVIAIQERAVRRALLIAAPAALLVATILVKMEKIIQIVPKIVIFIHTQ